MATISIAVRGIFKDYFMGVAIVLILVVVGSIVFHFLSPWYFTPIASNWQAMDDTVSITFWITGAVFAAVNLFMAYCVIRFRYRKDRRADYEPENKKLEIWLTALTTIGVAGMLAPGLAVWASFVDVPEDAAVVEAVGKQWHWSYRFPGEDGEMGAVDARFMTDDNPFGMDPDDPAGQDDILVDNSEVHLPVGVNTRFLLRSVDVLHNFAVAEFRVKMDLVPGLVTQLWFNPIRTGTFDVLCEELCGLAHFTMRGKVVVEEADAFEQWLSTYPTYAETLANPVGDPAAGKALYAVCAGCHGQEGEGNQALNVPKLNGQGDWYLARQLHYFKNGVRGTSEEDEYGKIMSPLAATLVDDKAVADVVAYIETLPDKPSAPTEKTEMADIAHGKKLYKTCSVCHDSDGSGIQAMNAPRLSGLDDWYLITQIQNFKHRVRGAHPQDAYGQQMISMAKILPDDEAITDLAFYINTLK